MGDLTETEIKALLEAGKVRWPAMWATRPSSSILPRASMNCSMTKELDSLK